METHVRLPAKQYTSLQIRDQTFASDANLFRGFSVYIIEENARRTWTDLDGRTSPIRRKEIFCEIEYVDRNRAAFPRRACGSRARAGGKGLSLLFHLSLLLAPKRCLQDNTP